MQDTSTGYSKGALATTLLALTAGLGAFACGGGSSGGGSAIGTPVGASAGAGDFLVQDAPVTSLLAFSATVTAVHLEIVGGGSTVNLLPAPVTVEFLGLQSTLGWLASLDAVPMGSYDGARLMFQPGSYIARANDGSNIAITAGSDQLLVNFTLPVVVDGSGYHRFEIDLDLAASITGDVSTPPLMFDPEGTANSSDGLTATEIDEIKGVIKSIDLATSSFIMDAFVDNDYVMSLGEVTVQVGASTLLFQENGLAFANSSDFFTGLLVSQTAVEIHGQLGANRIVSASKIEVEDQTAGASTSGIVKIEGLVSAIVPMVSFDITIREIEKAADIANPVLASLGSPTTITVSHDANTLFFTDANLTTDQSAIVLGQEVKVKFSMFSSSPFPASKVEVESAFPDFDGMITDVSGLPASLVIRLESLEPAVLNGQVTDSMTNVTVDLTGSTLFMDTEGEPSMVGMTIYSTMEIEVEGSISGLPGTPTIAGVKAKLKPGKLKDGLVATTDSMTSSFMLSAATVKDPFGNGVVTGALDVVISPSCAFDGDITEAQFFALFTGLTTGETLEVEVKGIATANPNEVMAFEIKSKVITP